MKYTWISYNFRTERGHRENVWFSRLLVTVTFGEVTVTSSVVEEQSLPR